MNEKTVELAPEAQPGSEPQAKAPEGVVVKEVTEQAKEQTDGRSPEGDRLIV